MKARNVKKTEDINFKVNLTLHFTEKSVATTGRLLLDRVKFLEHIMSMKRNLWKRFILIRQVLTETSYSEVLRKMNSLFSQ